jgi:cysteine-rich repeat protein
MERELAILYPTGWTLSNSTATSAFYAYNYCGNAVLNLAKSEQCDDGNTLSGDGCSTTCQIETGFYCTSTVCSAIPCTSIGYTGTAGSCVCNASGFAGTVTYTGGILGGCTTCASRFPASTSVASCTTCSVTSCRAGTCNTGYQTFTPGNPPSCTGFLVLVLVTFSMQLRLDWFHCALQAFRAPQRVIRALLVSAPAARATQAR